MQVYSLAEKGKPNAWNFLQARANNQTRIFMDADVVLEKDALSKLLHGLNKSECILVGAETKPYTRDLSIFGKLFARLLNSTSGSQIYLAGRLYAFDNQGLQKRFKELEFEEMPKHIIHEDAWLEIVVGEKFEVCHESKVFYRTYSLGESLKMAKRYLDARRQLEDEYPDLVADLRRRRNSIQTRYQRLMNTPGFMNKGFLITGALLRRAIAKYARIEYAVHGATSSPVDWEVSRASKKPIPLSY